MIYTYNKFRINISENIKNELNNFEQQNGQVEKGGMLLGYTANNELKITNITKPMICDISRRYNFVRNVFGHQFILYKKWKTSGRNINYIGEWHTHSEINPVPSRRDLKTLMEIRRYKNVNTPVIMLIVGQQKTYWIGINIDGYIHVCKKYID